MLEGVLEIIIIICSTVIYSIELIQHTLVHQATESSMLSNTLNNSLVNSISACTYRSILQNVASLYKRGPLHLSKQT